MARATGSCYLHIFGSYFRDFDFFPQNKKQTKKILHQILLLSTIEHLGQTASVQKVHSTIQKYIAI